MDLGRLIKWIVILALLLVGFKTLGPKLRDALNSNRAAKSSSTASKGDGSCVGRAEGASSKWGGGLGRFVNPPYDVEAWSSFKSDVDQHISEAEAACACEEESCIKARGAMSDLRSLVSEMDSSIRSGEPPASDIVRRQEAIDNAIDEARALISSRPE